MESITEINIREIALSGFRGRKEPAAYSFGDITCVTGHNGTGKTTLAHAAAFAFYGVTYFGEQKTDRLLNEESDICEVKLSLPTKTVRRIPLREDGRFLKPSCSLTAIP